MFEDISPALCKPVNTARTHQAQVGNTHITTAAGSESQRVFRKNSQVTALMQPTSQHADRPHVAATATAA
jgi:hypothetical protein